MPKNRAYNYIAQSTRTKLELISVVPPEGPITIKRRTQGGAKVQTISAAMIRRVANAVRPDAPINIDRILGASYNTRSALEALLAHTADFYYCYPGRIEIFESSSKIKKGHKHLLWRPDAPHEVGVTAKKEVNNMWISEISTTDAVYEALVLPDDVPEPGGPAQTPTDIELQRQHAIIQVALVEVAKQLGFRAWVAQNDKGIMYKGKKLGEMDGVIGRLQDVQLLTAFGDAARAASMIDCIWFREGKAMPAVIEVEHTTGVTRGLARMKNFQDQLPPFPTRWIIAAPDQDRDKVMQECNKPQFRSLNAYFLPYSAVVELHSLCQKRKVKGVTEEFLESFLEPCLTAQE